MRHDESDVLHDLPLFQALTPETRKRLVAGGAIRSYDRGSTLFVAGSSPAGLFIVLSGHVRVVRSHEGRLRVVHHEGPGGTLAEVPFFAGGLLPATAVASEPSRCLVLQAASLQRLMEEDAAVATLFLARLARRVRELVERLDRVVGQPVLARLAAFLETRSHATGSDVITLGMSQSALAEELGTAREVVARCLSQLRRTGVVESAGRGRLRIIDRARLSVLAGPLDSGGGVAYLLQRHDGNTHERLPDYGALPGAGRTAVPHADGAAHGTDGPA